MATSNFKGNGGGINGANLQPVTPMTRQAAGQQNAKVTVMPARAQFAETGKSIGGPQNMDGQNTTTKGIGIARQIAETGGKGIPKF